MNDILSIMQAIVPELKETFNNRLSILKVLIENDRPVGRKALANKIGKSERTTRTLIEALRESGLVKVARAGIMITSYGEEIINSINNNFRNENQFFELEEALKQKLSIEKCWIVPGDGDQSPIVFQLIAKLAQEILDQYLPRDKSVIAVTGGSTLAQVGEAFDDDLTKNRDLVFVPARGGVGGSFTIQSNTVAGIMSQKTGGSYVPLFIPESLDEPTSKLLLNNPSINEAISISKKADCLLLSVGAARIMAQRRNLSPGQYHEVTEGQAVGEAFGVFYDQEGKEIIHLPRIGIQLEDLKDIPLLLTLVAGASKAQALIAYFKLVNHQGWLVCDESLATMVLSGETH